MLRLSLATRLFLGYAVVLLSFGAVALFSVTELRRTQEEIRLLGEGYVALSQATSALEAFQQAHTRDTARIGDERNPATRRALVQLSRQYFFPQLDEKLTALEEQVGRVSGFAPAGERPFVGEVAQALAEVRLRTATYREVSFTVFAALDTQAVDLEEVATQLEPLTVQQQAVLSAIRLLQGRVEARIRSRVAEAEARERRTGIAILGLSVLAIAAGLLATTVAARALRPVRALMDEVARLGRGDAPAPLNVRGDDEIALLAREFDAMARSLKEREQLVRQQQEALVQAEKLAAAGRVAAQVAHEVRNPLSSIGLNVEMLDEVLGQARFSSPQVKDEARGLLASVTAEVDRLAEITEDYLKLARQPSPTLRREDLTALVDDVVELSRAELEKAGLAVVPRVDERPLEVMADEGQLRQVLLNLLRNAREAMGPGGTLTVRALRADGQVVLRVGDTGPGLSEEARRRLFEPFFTTKPQGTGLGLSISRQIVAAHGGTLEALEGGPGATLEVRLPLAPPR